MNSKLPIKLPELDAVSKSMDRNFTTKCIKCIIEILNSEEGEVKYGYDGSDLYGINKNNCIAHLVYINDIERMIISGEGDEYIKIYYNTRILTLTSNGWKNHSIKPIS